LCDLKHFKRNQEIGWTCHARLKCQEEGEESLLGSKRNEMRSLLPLSVSFLDVCPRRSWLHDLRFYLLSFPVVPSFSSLFASSHLIFCSCVFVQKSVKFHFVLWRKHIKSLEAMCKIAQSKSEANKSAQKRAACVVAVAEWRRYVSREESLLQSTSKSKCLHHRIS